MSSDRKMFSRGPKNTTVFHIPLRQLTAHPSQSLSTDLVPSNDNLKDIEEGLPNSDGPFDNLNLREYLTSFDEANKAAGIQPKHVGVTWENLQVTVGGSIDDKTYAPTFDSYMLQNSLSPIRSVWRVFSPIRTTMKDGDTRTILNRCSGLAKPGEMILVLGCPGSGCTTFLKAIGNERRGYSSVNGDVCYAGIDAAEMRKVYKGEVVYNQDDDVHMPTLTVAQTLAFALSTKTPGSKGRPPGMSSREYDAQAREMLLKMLNISHVSETLVGDEFVRGVSGGERKRVSIAEMMSTRAPVQCWDNPTRGLDASTAFDFVKSLRIMTDVFGQTTFVTLYQASEGIYNLFDRVLVMDKGRQIYLGSPSQARSYFEDLGFQSLPRQPTADYLTGCTDPNERQLFSGLTVADVPSTPEVLERAFLESELAVELLNELEEYKMSVKDDQESFRRSVLLDKRSGVSKKSPYTLGYVGQVMALARRQFQMRLQDRFQLVTSFSLSVILPIIIGAAFFDQKLTSNGVFTRTSVIFLSLLTCCLDAFGELCLVGGRGVLHKQASYRLYYPSALALGNALSDLPFSAVRLLLYNGIVYSMANLHRSWGAFWTFHLFSYMAFLSIQALFRTLGFFFSSYDAAFRMGGFLVTGLAFFTGYLIPVQQMKRWLFWVFYLNPMASAFSGLMENEFRRLDFTCDGSYIVPRNGFNVTKYPSTLGPNQVCTLFGARPGSDTTSGGSYLLTTYDMDSRDIWRRNFVLLFCWILLYQMTQIFVLDFLPQCASGAVFRLFAKETSETRKLNDRLRERKACRQQPKRANKSNSNGINFKGGATAPPEGGVFTWEGVNYHIPVSHGTRQLLNDVYGYVKHGTLTALMGASGAGKTTCLDVFAKRKNIGVVSGDILVDGRPTGPDFARSVAYAEQMYVCEGTATVREAMRFSAYLRQPFDVPTEEKNAYVEEVIELLELHDLADAIVGTLDIEACKRLSIGVELASKPGLLLFLDEPTSGLDAQSARDLIRVLRRLADKGQAILCTIHQPSSLLFESFDRLLLLEDGGNTVYFGDIGPDSCVVREYFARHGATCPREANPAEYMLDAIGAGTSPRVGHRDWKDIWLDSPEFQHVKEEIHELKLSATSRKTKMASKYATPFLYQLSVVTKRGFVTMWRSPGYIFTRLILHIFTALFASLVFLQLGRTQRDLQYRLFSIFWVSVLPSFLLNQILPAFMANRGIFIREFSSGMYSPEVFAISQLLGELPSSILCAIIFWAIMIYAQGFGQGSAGLGGTVFQLVVIISVEMFGVSLGQVIAAITPSVQVGILFDPFLMVILTTFCGVVIPYSNLAHTWRVWVYRLNPFTRMLSAMLSTELHGLQVLCNLSEFAIFHPPPNQSCATWASDFVGAFGGYLENPSDTQACRYCRYKVGDEYATQLNMFYENRWTDTWIIFAFFSLNFAGTIAASRFLRYTKR